MTLTRKVVFQPLYGFINSLSVAQTTEVFAQQCLKVILPNEAKGTVDSAGTAVLYQAFGISMADLIITAEQSVFCNPVVERAEAADGQRHVRLRILAEN